MKTKELKRSTHHTKDRQIFAVVGDCGAAHFWVKSMADATFFGELYIGGIEGHWRSKPGWSSREEPDNEDCWLLGGPCWHDGSSLQATEKGIPLWIDCVERDDMEPLWRWIESCYSANVAGGEQ